MKNYLLVILIFINFCNAQKYKITYSTVAIAEPCAPDPIIVSWDRISLCYNTTCNQIASASCSNLIDSHINTVKYINFLPNIAKEHRYAKSTSNIVVVDDNDLINVAFNHCDTKNIFFPLNQNNLQITIEPYTFINPQPTNNALCKVNLFVDQSGFAPEVYVWQYYNATTTQWVNFPQNLQGQSNITFTAIDLFGQQASNYYNTTINFRMQKYCVGKYTDVVSYVLLPCSPQLLNFSPTSPTCSYSQDGGFKMKLDRNLNANEQLVVTLYKESVTGSGNYDQLLGQKDTTTLINNGDGTFSYQWPDPVASGSYKVKYQTITVGATIQGWASLEFSPGFVVSNPPPVVFSGTKANNVYCKDGADGAINLNASGGVGNYKYEINNSGVWVPFANPNTHTINGLPKGTLTLKVQDGNGCTEKL